MVHVNEDCKHLIERKIDRINRDLSSIDDNIPKVALSAGISLCSQSEDAQDALREASIALSHIKKSNRGRCFFYTPGLDK